MQSLIRQIGVRAGTLLMRRHPQMSIAHGYTGAHGAGGVAETADEQIRMLNGLLQMGARGSSGCAMSFGPGLVAETMLFHMCA